ncbi:hypothetical protein [Nocardioides sp.]|uniref:hypothetical protein n=1 Tax=Nocardioides sp. TaxID=35761 RepID=UPI002B86495D|nr:hypothetical protein [Nocardioides sp.]HXH78805.1 hypothetical protein [Nocardioides sp.]
MRPRLLLFAALLLSTISTLSACADPGPGAEDVAGCGSCEREVADIRTQLEALDGITMVKRVEFIPESPTNGSGVDIELRSSQPSEGDLASEAARIVWQSRVQPVEVVNISIKLADGSMAQLLPYDFRETSREHASYVEEWGERPVE